MNKASQSRSPDLSGLEMLYSERFDMLDAWRGVAALAVVVSHTILVPAVGTFAVLVFFVISGYCITAAADSCRRKDLGFRTFMWRRVRRIYPPYFLAVLFFLATRLLKYAMTGQSQQLDRPVIVYVQNFTLTQWISLIFQPLNNAFDNNTLFVAAFWSLNYEEQFYLLMAILLFFGSIRKLGFGLPIVLLLVVALGWNARFPNICYGFFIEYWAHFAIGAILFYRLCRITSRRTRRLIDFGLTIMLLLCSWVAWRQGEFLSKDRFAPTELAVVSGFGLLLIALRPLSERFQVTIPGLILSRLGLISYSLYLIHQFNVVFVETITKRILPAGAPYLLSVATQLCFHVVLATIFWRFCERPFLNKSLPAKATSQLEPIPATTAVGAVSLAVDRDR